MVSSCGQHNTTIFFEEVVYCELKISGIVTVTLTEAIASKLQLATCANPQDQVSDLVQVFDSTKPAVEESTTVDVLWEKYSVDPIFQRLQMELGFQTPETFNAQVNNISFTQYFYHDCSASNLALIFQLTVTLLPHLRVDTFFLTQALVKEQS
jgi:hypothetical protein